MATSDLGHKLTDAELAKLERRIGKLYREAGEELQATIDAYFEQFKKRDEEMKALIGTVQNGKEWTEADYKQWRLNQIGRGERYQAMRDKVARRTTDANAVAVSYANDATPGIYSLNRNYAAYTIEQVAGNVGFDLWDEQTVKRLMVEQPDLMPYYPPKRALKRGIDLAYGKKQITASVTSSILQGKSIKHMADDLQKRITTMSRDSAIRTARTAVTGAQNAGRMDSYAAAEKMGIKLKKEWLATLDARTRHSHAMLDGEQVAQDKKFSNGCRFPGDPQGPPWEIYNCRCTLIAAVEGVDTSSAQRRARNAATGQTEVISNMTYAEWTGWKEKTGYKAMPQGYRRKFMRQLPQEKEVFRFQPAKTQNEATSYMSRITRSDVPVVIGKGVTVEQENAINMALTDIYNRYGIKLDIKEVAHANGKYQAAYSPKSKKLLVKGNKSTWAHNAETNYKSGWNASGDPYQVFYHELGHAVWEELPHTAKLKVNEVYRKYTHEAYEEWMRLGGSQSGEKQAEVFANYLSQYGHQDKYEFFSECFAQIMTDYDGIAAFDVGDILDEVFRK